MLIVGVVIAACYGAPEARNDAGMRQVWGTLGGRWYVTIFGAVFFWRASRHLGWRKTLIYAVATVGLGALAENGSVHFGFPYTRYAFNPALRGKELFVGDVP